MQWSKIYSMEVKLILLVLLCIMKMMSSLTYVLGDIIYHHEDGGDEIYEDYYDLDESGWKGSMERSSEVYQLQDDIYDTQGMFDDDGEEDGKQDDEGLLGNTSEL